MATAFNLSIKVMLKRAWTFREIVKDRKALFLIFVFTVTPGRACFSNGKTYANGEVFQLGCKHKCTCLDGVLGCTPLCPITIMAKAPKVSSFFVDSGRNNSTF